MRILVVDDQRIFKFGTDHTVQHELTAQHGLAAMMWEGPWDEVYLDHDLGQASKADGTKLAHSIAFLKPEVGRFYVHSMNVVGRKNMLKILLDAEYWVGEIIWTPNLIQQHINHAEMERQGRHMFYQEFSGG